jgi:GxxExxY protein
MLIADELTDRVIGLAVEVHRHTGPGLLESVYERCLYHELKTAGIRFDRQKPLPVKYKGISLDAGFRADMVVENALLIEIKAVGSILPVHNTQVLTYLRMSGYRVGLLLNFHAPRLKDGLHRFVV